MGDRLYRWPINGRCPPGALIENRVCSYSVESGGEVKMTKQEIISMIETCGLRGWGEGYGL